MTPTFDFNKTLCERANWAFAGSELTAAQLGARTGLSSPRIQRILDHQTRASMAEWEAIFTALDTDPFGAPWSTTTSLPPSGATPPAFADPAQFHRVMSEVCGAKHRHLNIWCDQRAGHEGDHQGNGYSWVEPGAGPSLTDRLAALEKQSAHVAKSLPALAPLSRLEALEKAVQKIKDRLSAAGD